MREWLTVIIVLLIVGVLLDGLRRMRRARRESLRLSRRARKLDLDDLPDPNTEVCSEPRVVRQRDERDAESLTKTMRESFAKTRVTVGAPKRIPEQVSLNLEQAVPMLMDSVDEEHQDGAAVAGQPRPAKRDYTQPPSWAEAPVYRQPKPEPRQAQVQEQEEYHSAEDDYSAYDDDEQNDDRYADELYSESEHDNYGSLHDEDYELSAPSTRRRSMAEPSLGSLDDLADDEPEVAFADDEDFDDLDAVDAAQEAQQQPQRGAKKPSREELPPEPEEVLIINLMAPAGQRFQGEELLQALLSQGLRFGSMNIFHRHKHADGSGPVRFSLANMVVPGTFDLSTMSEFDTPGVSMFMSLPNEDESLAAFECMAETAKALAAELGGELKDENRSVMTRQTLEHSRQRVLEFERKQRLMQRA